MPILKTLSTGNGLAQACRVEEIFAKRNNMAGDGWHVQIGLYADIDSCREGRNLMWQLYPVIPLDAIDPANVFDSVEQYLLTIEGEFQGGTFVATVSETPLEDAKAKKWSETKGDRIRAEDAGFAFEGIGTFQSDADSRQKIVGASLAAKIAKDGGQPYAVDWTLADNSVVPLNADQMIAVGQALLVHLDGVHQHSRNLYTLIQAAETVEVVEAINWSTAA